MNNHMNKNLWKRISLDPLVDWVTMLVAGLVVAVIMISIGVFVYINVGAATSSVSDQPFTPHSPIDALEPARVVGLLAGRFGISSSTRSVARQISSGDPSL
jgi:hypothetical protein